MTIGLEPDRITKSLPQIKKLHAVARRHRPRDDRRRAARARRAAELLRADRDRSRRRALRDRAAPAARADHAACSSSATKACSRRRTLLGAQLIGTVGEITAERLQQLGPPYRVGDLVGLGGLQAAFETRLAGRPTGTVDRSRPGDQGRAHGEAVPGPRPAARRRSRSIPRVQHAADTALAGVTLPAALVAIDVPTGQIRAVVSKPDNGFDRALDGAYPPGSTFKVITSTALLAAGRTGSTPAPCPPTLTVDGETFKNFEGEASGAIDLAERVQDLVQQRVHRSRRQAARRRAREGRGARTASACTWSLPVAVVRRHVPEAEATRRARGVGDRAGPHPREPAADGVGRRRGRVGPVARTRRSRPSPRSTADHRARARPRRRSRRCAAFMASVEQPGGTAAGAGLPAGVFGKTGTAEFGSGEPARRRTRGSSATTATSRSR